MKTVALNLVAAAALLAWTSAACAADFAFSFTDDSVADMFGRAHVPGTVTGVLHGLADDSISMPTYITLTSDESIFGITADKIFVDVTLGAGFTVVDNQVVDADAVFNFHQAAGPTIWQLRFNRFEAYTPISGLNALLWDGGPYPMIGVGNQGFAGATYLHVPTAAPEPATWAMMILGFGLTGAMMRRRLADVA